MAFEKTTIKKTTDETRFALQRASAWGLPNRPSERGMKAEDIKKAFWKPFLDANGSLLKELDRVVDEINALMSEFDRVVDEINALMSERNEEGDATEALETEARTVIGAINEVRQKLGDGNAEVEEAADLTDAINRFYQKYKALIGENTLETADKTVIGAINEVKGAADKAANHAGANESQIEEIKGKIEEIGSEMENDIKPDIEDMETSIAGLRAETQGIARSYVLNGFFELTKFMQGVLAVDTDVYAKDLKTGDNLLLIEKNVPDFWFEETNREIGYETYQYPDENSDETKLICYNGGAVCGHLHIAETDYTVIAGHATSAAQKAANAKKSAEEAETAKDRAEAAQRAAETAKVGAEAAQSAAETAKDRAEAAQSAAETAKDRAEAAVASLDDIGLTVADGKLNITFEEDISL